MIAEQDATSIAAAIRAGALSAGDAIEEAISMAHGRGTELNCFSEVLDERGRAEAAAVDARGAGIGAEPLAGVPFAAKDLFDVDGVVTRAGSKINLADPPARRDADAIRLMNAAGATLVGTTVMDEYAYGFTTENEHYGPVRNPHDPDRIAGGSSGGSAAAVAAGIVPLALGSDTNGSARVPAALCGILGLRPTYGTIALGGMELFAPSFDTVGLFARSAADMAVGLGVLQGSIEGVEPAPGGKRSGSGSPLERRSEYPWGAAIRVAIAGGYFRRGAHPEVLSRVDTVAAQLGTDAVVDVPGAAEARAAALVITAAEGAQRHLADLRTRPAAFDRMTRGRFLAGALVPASDYLTAQRFRTWFRERISAVFDDVDVLLTATTPFTAPLIGQREEVVDGVTVLTQPYLGVFTQPLSFIGLPALSVPAGLIEGLPVGVQLVARPHGEAMLLELAARIEAIS